MADGIDTPLNTPELAAGNPILNRSPPQPKSQELPPTYDPVLGLRKIPNLTIDRTRRRFFSYDMGNRRLVRHRPILPGAGARMVRSMSRNAQKKEAPARRYRLWL
jgi:hypothetical protein